MELKCTCYHFILSSHKTLTSCDPTARYKGIPCVARVTSTLCVVIVDGTGGVSPTHSRTRITTLIVDARLVPWTLRVDRTLRLTLNVGVADIVKYTPAGGSLTALRAFGVATTW